MANGQLSAGTIVELVATVGNVRNIVEQHPELKHVAEELLTMKGPLPNLQARAMTPVVTRKPITRTTPKPMSAAYRKKLSVAMKNRWKVAKKAGKNTV